MAKINNDENNQWRIESSHQRSVIMKISIIKAYENKYGI